uniref:Uncharacterized protein n=1 Tax=Oryza brachyantha TaxID=4533 RepID=J3MN72_ORYBR
CRRSSSSTRRTTSTAMPATTGCKIKSISPKLHHLYSSLYVYTIIIPTKNRSKVVVYT